MSGHAKVALDYADSPLRDEFGSTFWDVFLPPGRRSEPAFDQDYEGLRESNHEHIHPQSSVLPAGVANLSDLLEDVDDRKPCTTNSYPQHGNHVPTSVIETMETKISAQEESGNNLWDWDAVRTPARQFKHTSDHVYDGHGSTSHKQMNHENLVLTGNSNTPLGFMDISYSKPQTMNRDSLDANHIPMSVMEEIQTEDSGDLENFLHYPSLMKSGHSKSHLIHKYNSDVWDLSVQTPEKQCEQVADHMSRWPGETTHDNINSKISTLPPVVANLHHVMEDINYSEPYTTNSYSEDGKHIPNSIIEPHWDDLHVVPLHDIFNPQLPSPLNSPIHISTDLSDLENQGGNEQLSELPNSLNWMDQQFQNSPKHTPEKVFGLTHKDQVLSDGYISPSNSPGYYEGVLPNKSLLYKTLGSRSSKEHIKPHSSNKDPAPNHDSFKNVAIKKGSRGKRPTPGSLLESKMEHLNETKSKKMKTNCATLMDKKDKTISKRLDLEIPSSVKARKFKTTQESLKIIKETKWEDQVQIPEKLVGVLNLQKVSGKASKSKNNYAKSSSQKNIVASHRNQVLLLQRIGILHVNRSATLCYEIYEFFAELYRNILLKFATNSLAIRSATQALKNAGFGVVMAFLGTLRVFEGDGMGEADLQILLNDGWTYIQQQFNTWKSAELEDLRIGKNATPNLALVTNPKFFLHYLKEYKTARDIPITLVYYFSQDWAKQRQRLKIPRGPHYGRYVGRIDAIYKTESNSVQGGMYQRGDISNYVFWGPEQFSRKPWHQYGQTTRESEKSLVLSSLGAQFHTPIGREMCQVVHTFFEDLIHNLLHSYKDINGYKHSQVLPPKALEHIDMIIKTVSFAQYRVTVVVIGAIRIWNQGHLDSSQLQRLLSHAWEFLKMKFSEWRSLNLDQGTSTALFSTDSVKLWQKDGLKNPENLFRTLGQTKAKYGFPKRCIAYLLRSWMSSISEEIPGSKEWLGFQVAGIPNGPVESWNFDP